MQLSTSKPSFSQARDALFLAGASPTSWYFLVPAALFTALAITTQWGVFSWLAFFAQLAVLWRGMTLLARFSQGVFDAEAELGNSLISVEFVLRALALWTGLTMLSWLARLESQAFGVGYDLVIALVKPALLISLAMGSTLRDTLYLGRPWFVVSTIGWRYCWPCLGMLLLSLGAGGLFDTRSNPTLLFVGSLAIELLAYYCVLVSFAMMGYFMHVKSDELGLHTLASEYEPVDTAKLELAVVEDDPAKLLARGQVEEALGLLYEAARLAPDGVTQQQEYYNALMRHGAKDAPGATKQLVQAGRLLRAYARAERAADVARLMELWWPALQDELLSHTGTCLQVAALSVQGGSPERALELMTAFERINKGSVDMPIVLLAHAELLLTLKRSAEAVPLAQEIVALYSHREEAARAREIVQAAGGAA